MNGVTMQITVTFVDITVLLLYTWTTFLWDFWKSFGITEAALTPVNSANTGRFLLPPCVLFAKTEVLFKWSDNEESF